MSKILTVCSQGLCRSVGLADVLKLHFEPVDVIPVGVAKNANSPDTLIMLCHWADHIISMEPIIQQRLQERTGLDLITDISGSRHICDVGPDTYGGRNNRIHVLIDKVWRWTRENQDKLGIKEHTKRL